MDVSNKSYAQVDGAVVKLDAPTPLKQSPDGWADIEIDFATSAKYFNLARSFSLPLKFINDGAAILRYLMNTGKGYEEEVYISIMRWDRETGNYTQEYYGKIDLSQYSDDPLGKVAVNAIEGGISADIIADDGTAYDIICDETNEDCVQVELDGINLKDSYHYQVLDIGTPYALPEGSNLNYFIPCTFLDKNGDSLDLVTNNATFSGFTDPNTTLPTSDNYILENVGGNLNIGTSGHITLTYINHVHSYPSGAAFIYIKYGIFDVDLNTVSIAELDVIDLSTIYPTPVEVAQHTFNIIFPTIHFPKNSKIFLFANVVFQSYADSFLQFGATDFYLNTITRAPSSLSYALRPLDLLRSIIDKMTGGKYSAESSFFTTNNNLLTTCGDAIRNTQKGADFVIKNYIISTSFADWFTSYNSVYNLGIKIIGNVLFVEPKADLYGDDEQIFDIGEVSKLTIAVAKDYLTNSVMAGYPNQDYNEQSGKLEFNTITNYGLPVKSVSKVYDISSKYRGDCFGQEFIRKNYTGQDNTDNTGDKEAFLIDSVASVSSESFILVCTFSYNSIYFTDISDMSKFNLGDLVTTTGTTLNNVTSIKIINIFPINGSGMYQFGIDLDISSDGSNGEDNVSTNFSVSGTIIIPNRPAYSVITGVTDNSVYNTTISPKRQLVAHGNYLRALLIQQPEGTIDFQTGDKNTQLSTTLDGNTVTENASEVIGNLANPLFLPYEIAFTSRVPYRFTEILSQFGKGYIKLSYNGYTLYCLPIGTMKAKPAINESQQWKLLCAPKTDLNTLFQLSGNGQFFFNMDNSIFISDLNPLHFVKYDFQIPAKYHETGMYNAWVTERITRFLGNSNYVQPWQIGDTIELQFIANSNAADISVKIHSCSSGDVVDQQVIATPNASVQSPNILLQTSIQTTGLDEGNYVAVIYSASDPIAISEPFSISDDCENTYLFEYSNSYNLLDGYFNGWNPSIRVEALWDKVLPMSTITDYEDELGNSEILSGSTTYIRKLWLGSVYGIPDWMALKMNRILVLNNILIDGQPFSRAAISKFSTHDIVGQPNSYYDLDMSPATDDNGFEMPLTKTTTMIYYGTLPTSADPTIADKFFIGNPTDSIIVDYGIVNASAFFWFFIPKGFGLKANWQDVSQPLITGTINGAGDLFQSKDFTINGIDGDLYKSQWATLFNNNPTTRIKAF